MNDTRQLFNHLVNRHSKLGYLSPNDYELKMAEK
jgi:hypothetical protein